jgi:hypothetical protein
MTEFPWNCITTAALVLGAICALPAQAGIVTVPGGLAPGDHYELIFITSGSYSASSTSNSTYDGDVEAEASLNPALSSLGPFTADVGTPACPSPTALNNNACELQAATYPVYDLRGDLVSFGLQSFNQGSAAGVSFDVNGNYISIGPLVWTGIYIPGAAGSLTNNLGTEFPIYGVPGDSGPDAIDSALAGASTMIFGMSPANAALYRLYAVSPVLTVPDAPLPPAPEPSTWALLASSLIALAGFRKKRLRGKQERCQPLAPMRESRCRHIGVAWRN